MTEYRVTLFSNLIPLEQVFLSRLRHLPGPYTGLPRLLDLIQPPLSPGSHSWLCYFFSNGATTPSVTQTESSYQRLSIVVSIPYFLSTNQLILLVKCLL